MERIKHVETQIRVTRLQIKSAKAVLSGYAGSDADRIHQRQIKSAIKARSSKLEGYKRVLHILKDIGDALAFTYGDKYDIKPMRFKEASGFVSGKAGLRKEWRVLQKIFKLGGVGILNDVTHCLRYGDITAGQGDKLFAIVEVKSGTHRNQRARRQSANIKRVVDYLKTDVTHDLYGIHGEFNRFAVCSEEVNHRKRLDGIIRRAKECGLNWEEVEKGLFYVVMCESRLDWMASVRQRCKGQPMLAIVNDFKWQNSAYYPFTLSIHNLDALWEFYLGKLFIAIVVDTKVLEERFNSLGLSAELLDEDNCVLRLRNLGWQMSGSKETDCRVSRGFFGRLFAEFLSLEWLCDQIACGVRNIDSRLRMKPVP
ncbi:MAG: hypothetical protein Q7T26_05665 [Dehalococcoidia bacterium]|nr:hypothetical protein [Dehalococcoidia bacterium]